MGEVICSPFEIIYQVYICSDLLKQQQHEKLAKLAKKNVSSFWGVEPETNLRSQLLRSLHPPPCLLREGPFCSYTKQGSDTYEFIHFAGCMNSQVTGNEFVGHRVYEFILLMYEFISGHECAARAASAQREPRGRSPRSPPAPTVRVAFGCPDRQGCVRLPQPVRVRLAAPTSQGAFGCPDQLGCARQGVWVRNGNRQQDRIHMNSYISTKFAKNS